MSAPMITGVVSKLKFTGHDSNFTQSNLVRTVYYISIKIFTVILCKKFRHSSVQYNIKVDINIGGFEKKKLHVIFAIM